MIKDSPFMALGGAQRVGGSCYYLGFGTAHILLDAGGNFHRGIVSGPRFSDLLGSPLLESMKQITHIFISHAHNDHVASLMPIMEETPYAQVYMTDLTWKLASFQIDRQISVNYSSAIGSLVKQKLMDRITRVNFMQTIDCGGFKATFLPAGHIPGAMMVLLDDGRRKVLYTGDYSVEDTAMTGACVIPENEEIDTMILCALHAKHSFYSWNSNDLFQSVQKVFEIVENHNCNVLCCVGQLTKGVEFLVALNTMNVDHIPIRIASSVTDMVELMESSGVRILTIDNYDDRARPPKEPYIYISTENDIPLGYRSVNQRIDFSLHDDFDGMRRLIQRVNPRQAVMVHCAQSRNEYEDTIEQVILRDPDCRTQFLFPEEGIVYLI